MSEPRLKSRLWTQMALRMGDAAGTPGAVLRHGEDSAGGILVVLRGRAGLTVLDQTRDAAGAAAWTRGTGAAAVDQTVADAYVARQVSRDPDLWVLEFETPDLTPPFPARIV